MTYKSGTTVPKSLVYTETVFRLYFKQLQIRNTKTIFLKLIKIIMISL